MVTPDPNPRTPLRVWPGIAAVAVMMLAAVLLPLFMPGGPWVILAGVAGGLAVLLWWLLFSRAPWTERAGALALMVVAVLAASRIVHESISNGMMGMMLPIFSIPVLSVALVAWAVASRGLARGPRRASMVVTILLAGGAFALIRTGGISGEGNPELHWRWTPTPEERLLAEAGANPVVHPPAPPAAAAATPVTPSPDSPAPAVEPAAPSAAPPQAKSPDEPTAWGGFRGPARDGVVRGVRIETDWSAKPPAEVWRRAIGPGWSSFAVEGDLVYTQEQRGGDELVSCYRLTTGEPVWIHRDPVRFWESNGGAGPRATPTVRGGRVYTFGATGILNALDARDGSLVWSRNAATDTDTVVPDWGFASSPLVVGDVVIVAASGALAAYAVATGEPRWYGPKGGGGYSSPHLATIGGVPQVLLLRGSRTISVAPADGALLWDHTWVPGAGFVQPGLAGDGDVLLSTGDAMGGLGIRRVAVARGAAGWTVEERWTSRGLKPYFNDFVIHEGHAFGFDGSILASIDLATGERKWKGGRYGHGQALLLPDQDLLLVLSEEGELALVNASPDQFTERARFKAIEGKTWNHPVLVGDLVLVRNGEEMAAFRLALAAAGGATRQSTRR